MKLLMRLVAAIPLLVAAAIPLWAQADSYRQGDVVAVNVPAGNSGVREVRIVAVPGDAVRIGEAGVFVNGQAAGDPPAGLRAAFRVTPVSVVVPPGQYFVAGSGTVESRASALGEWLPPDRTDEQIFGLIKATRLAGTIR